MRCVQVGIIRKQYDLNFDVSGKSLTYSKKSKGPTTELCDMPRVILQSLDLVFSKNVRIFLLSRYDFEMFQNLPQKS